MFLATSFFFVIVFTTSIIVFTVLAQAARIFENASTVAGILMRAGIIRLTTNVFFAKIVALKQKQIWFSGAPY